MKLSRFEDTACVKRKMLHARVFLPRLQVRTSSLSCYHLLRRAILRPYGRSLVLLADFSPGTKVIGHLMEVCHAAFLPTQSRLMKANSGTIETLVHELHTFGRPNSRDLHPFKKLTTDLA